MRNQEIILKDILTGDYCGVALGYMDEQFIIYQWGDAPVSSEILGRGRTIINAISEYLKWHNKNFTRSGKRRKKTWSHPYA